MTPEAMHLSAQALAFVFTLGAIAAALAATMARSLVAMCMGLAAMGACAAAAVLALGAGDAGLGLALLVATLAPVFMLAGLLLSSRAAKAHKRGPVWMSAVAAFAVGATMLAALPELGAAPMRTISAAHSAVGLWLAALVFVSAISALAALGYGERGPFERERER